MSGFLGRRVSLGVLLVTGSVSCSALEPEVSEQAAAVSAPTCVTIQRGKLGQVADAYIKKNALKKNFGGQPSLRVSDKEETLLRFDLASIPVGAAVQSGKLKLYVNGDNGSGTTEVHRIKAPWAESTVTFASFGQQFGDHVVAEFRTESKTALKSIDVTGLVGKWLAGEANNGLLLKPGRDHTPRCNRDDDDDEDPTVFVSSEGTNVNRRPALEICYTLPTNRCAPNPCQHGGTCVNGASGYTCQCAPGFDGPTCQHAIDDCQPNPCQHGGNCTDTGTAFSCACPPGFTGATCEVDVDDCASGPCRNGATCTDGVASFTCACAPGYDGALCDHLIDNCAGEPCHNGAACTNRPGGYSCACAPGFTGPTCDTNVDDCVANTCQNGGTCIDGVNTYSCSCAPDWGGTRCEVNLNTCAQQPCLNAGVCTNTPGNYACACPPGYAGTSCEIDVDDCAPNPCLNGGLCVDGVASFTCTCQAGFAGARCEIDVCMTLSCDDHNACTADTCSAGGCGHAPVGCDDGNPCTVDRCDAALGCAHETASCDDGNACTADSCGANGCQHATITCDDFNPCTADRCDVLAGCAHDAVTCDDGNACTADSCGANGCQHAAVTCDDGNACTSDTCDAATGCGHTTITCNDGDACTVDSCDPALGCRATAGDCCAGQPSVGAVIDVAATTSTTFTFCLPAGIRAGVGVSSLGQSVLLRATLTDPQGHAQMVSNIPSVGFFLPTTAAGTYQLAVTALSAVPLRLAIEQVPADVVLDITPGRPPQTATLTSYNQHARFRFDATAGQRVYLQVPSSAPTNSARLTGPGGVLLQQAILLDLQGVQAIAVTGTYEVDVAPLSGLALPQQLTLSALDVPPDPVVPLVVDGPAAAFSLSSGQTGHATFSGSIGDVVNLSWSGPTAPTQYWVYSPSGTVLAQSLFAGYLRVVISEPGTYEVRSTTPSWSAALSDEPADLDVAIPFGGPASSYSLAAFQNATVHFDVPTGRVFSFAHNNGCITNPPLIGPTGATYAYGCTNRGLFYAPVGGTYHYLEPEQGGAFTAKAQFVTYPTVVFGPNNAVLVTTPMAIQVPVEPGQTITFQTATTPNPQVDVTMFGADGIPVVSTTSSLPFVRSYTATAYGLAVLWVHNVIPTSQTIVSISSP